MLSIFKEPPDFTESRSAYTAENFKNAYTYQKYGGPSLGQFMETEVPIDDWIYEQYNTGEFYKFENITMFDTDVYNNTLMDIHFIMRENLTWGDKELFDYVMKNSTVHNCCYYYDTEWNTWLNNSLS